MLQIKYKCKLQHGLCKSLNKRKITSLLANLLKATRWFRNIIQHRIELETCAKASIGKEDYIKIQYTNLIII